MATGIKRLLLAVLCLPAALAAAGTVVKVAFYESIPPWVNVAGRPGIAVELLQEALRSEGIAMQPVFYPLSRRISAYRRGEVDALYDVTPAQQHHYQLPGSIGRDLHAFDNVVVALERQRLELAQPQDLQELQVMAWEGAEPDLPLGYDRLLAQATGHYGELSDQGSQVRSLYLGRSDAIMIDRLIFEWYRRQLGPQAQLPVTLYPLLMPKEANVLWRDPLLRQHFDRGLRKLKQDGRYDAVFRRYHSQPQP
ncbi:substrate-binding periplasmic protein [Vogesella oryzae]|uniref:substrate-binding periplasmic protein n=1 Tax=Vogesella oryzae TaxID=1735285 RepID=UPI0015822ED9|nr:transporter substrate-binding domain-containing protein [Vogesella oryzae]